MHFFGNKFLKFFRDLVKTLYPYHDSLIPINLSKNEITFGHF